jgi:hypothetical protein
VLGAGLGCSTLSGYSTGTGESYCGAVTTTATFRAGLAAGAQMRLSLDATLLDGEASPGVVSTYEPASGATPARRLLDRVALRRVPALENDPLAAPDLGTGRDQSHVFALTPTAPGEDPLLTVVSLRSDGGVEVRLVRPGVATTAPPGHDPVFGLFTLVKQAGACGF